MLYELGEYSIPLDYDRLVESCGTTSPGSVMANRYTGTPLPECDTSTTHSSI
jgi:hypothetical protein